jgi:hypothetical protein
MSEIIKFPRACRPHPEPVRDPFAVRVLRSEGEWFVIYDGTADLHTDLNNALNDAFELSDALGGVRITIDR